MTEKDSQDQIHSQTKADQGQDSPAPHDEFAEPVKTPERLRREEIFLNVVRTILIAGVCWAGYYAVWTLTKSQEELQVLAEETIHDSLQFGSVIFLGAELLYYLYVSSSFRGCREWGMIVWIVGVIALIVNLRASA